MTFKDAHNDEKIIGRHANSSALSRGHRVFWHQMGGGVIDWR